MRTALFLDFCSNMIILHSRPIFLSTIYVPSRTHDSEPHTHCTPHVRRSLKVSSNTQQRVMSAINSFCTVQRTFWFSFFLFSSNRTGRVRSLHSDADMFCGHMPDVLFLDYESCDHSVAFSAIRRLRSINGKKPDRRYPVQYCCASEIFFVVI